MKNILFDLAISIITGIFVCLIVLPMLTLFTATSYSELVAQVKSPIILSAIFISFETSLTVVFLSLCLGIPVAYLLAMKDFKGKKILDTLVDLPVSIPPLVAGLAFLVLFGGNSKLGRFLSSHGVDLLFSKKGIIIAQLFVSIPFLINSTKDAFESINKNIINASLTLGASNFYMFKTILIPLAKNGIYTGMIMTWSRAMGEFGATSMVAGCIPFKTETMTVAIYQNAMTGEPTASIAVALLLLVFSFTLLLIFKLRIKKGSI